jgi:hypothetical protein
VGKPKKSFAAKSLTRKTKACAEQKGSTGNVPHAGFIESGSVVAVDRRSSGDRRRTEDRRKIDVPVAAERRQLTRRQKVSRRRQIDPTTCERNYSAEEIEFMTALEGYKRTSGRMFPTCSEVLEVLRGLGYEKRENVEPGVPSPPVETSAPAAVTAFPDMASVL